MRSGLFASLHRVATVFLLFAGMGLAARGEDLDSVMYRDPVVPVPKFVKTHPQGLADLWITALKRPERELRTSAAQAIAVAHERGMPGLKVAVGPLTEMIETPNQHPAVLASGARALVVVDARDSASALLTLPSDTPELREIVSRPWRGARARARPLDQRLNRPQPHTRLQEAATTGKFERRAVPG